MSLKPLVIKGDDVKRKPKRGAKGTHAVNRTKNEKKTASGGKKK